MGSINKSAKPVRFTNSESELLTNYMAIIMAETLPQSP